jgi:hypothetical protein
MLKLQKNLIYNNTATDGPGGGLMVTDITRAYTSCTTPGSQGMELPLSKCPVLDVLGAGGDGRIMQTRMGFNSSKPLNTAARGSYGDDLASAANSVVVLDPKLDEEITCVSAAPGGLITVDIALRDWLNKTVQLGVDATMVVKVTI